MQLNSPLVESVLYTPCVFYGFENVTRECVAHKHTLTIYGIKCRSQMVTERQKCCCRTKMLICFLPPNKSHNHRAREDTKHVVKLRKKKLAQYANDLLSKNTESTTTVLYSSSATYTFVLMLFEQPENTLSPVNITIVCRGAHIKNTVCRAAVK